MMTRHPFPSLCSPIPPQGLDDGRVSFVGDIKKVPDEEQAAARDTYLAKHPGHFWVDFGDFDFFRMEEIKAVRYNGGFARFGALESEGELFGCMRFWSRGI